MYAKFILVICESLMSFMLYSIRIFWSLETIVYLTVKRKKGSISSAGTLIMSK